jgi:hypothetical protein
MSRAAYGRLWLSPVTAGKLQDGTSYKSTTTSTFLRLLQFASFDATFTAVTA